MDGRTFEVMLTIGFVAACLVIFAIGLLAPPPRPRVSSIAEKNSAADSYRRRAHRAGATSDDEAQPPR